MNENREPVAKSVAIERPSLARLGFLFAIAVAVFLILVGGMLCDLPAWAILVVLTATLTLKIWAHRKQRDRVSNPLNVVVAALCILLFANVLMPRIGSRNDGHLAACINNLNNFGVALRSYYAKNGSFPPVYTTDQDGKPLCSWRTAILPFLERNDISSQYHPDEPWDGPHNTKFTNQPLEIFHCPSNLSPDTCDTSYVAIIGPGTAWEENRGLKLSDITDNPHDTILLVEMKNTGIKWAEPRDLDLNNLPPGVTKENLLERLSNHPGCFNAVFADGHVEVIPSDIPWADFEAMLTIAGGEKIDRDKW